VFDAFQLATKSVLTVATLIVAAIVIARVWRSDLDLRELFSPRGILARATDPHVAWIPTRDSASIYQSGRVVGKVDAEPQVNELIGTLTFREIRNAGDLNFAQEFEFRRWRLRFQESKAADGSAQGYFDTSRSEKGRIVPDVVCQILGTRSP
jgi:hypothetical protein